MNISDSEFSTEGSQSSAPLGANEVHRPPEARGNSNGLHQSGIGLHQSETASPRGDGIEISTTGISIGPSTSTNGDGKSSDSGHSSSARSTQNTRQGGDPLSPKGEKHPSILKRVLLTLGGVILLAGLTVAIVLTWFPNIVVHQFMEPKFQTWVHKKFGDSYSLDIASMTLNSTRDSLIITGVRLIDNGGQLLQGKVVPIGTNPVGSSPLQRMLIDTIKIAGVDYWKLISDDGLFSGSITIHGPKIFLRPGEFPKFASTEELMPQFLPIVSTKKISIEDAQIFIADGREASTIPPTPTGTVPPGARGLLIKRASLELRDFYIDQTTATAANRQHTYFSSSASFTAEDISHVNPNGLTDLLAVSASGNLIDSTMSLRSVRLEEPTTSIRRASIDQVDLTELDWNAALGRHGLHAGRMTVTAPQFYLQNNASMPSIESNELVRLPKVVPNVVIGTVAVSNGEVYNILPGSRRINQLKRVSLVLHDLALDSTSMMTGVSSLFSHDANFAITGTTTLTGTAGSASFTNLHGDLRSVQLASLQLHPKIEGIRRVSMRSFRANGIDWSKLLMHKGLFAGSVILQSPVVALDPLYKGHSVATDRDGRATKKPSAPTTAALQLFGMLSDATKSPLPDIIPVVAAGTISITDGTLTGVRFFDGSAAPAGTQPNPKQTGDSLHGIKISLRKFRLDKNSFLADRGRLFSQSGAYSFVDFDHVTADGQYNLSEAGGHGDLATKRLTVDSLLLQPLFDENAFSASARSNTERIDFYAPQVVIAGFDLQKLLTGKGIFADSIFAANWKLDLYADKRLPRDSSTLPAIYPHEAFQHITTLLGVRTIISQGGYLSFRDRYPVGTEPGRITLNDVNAQIGPVSNDLSMVSRDEPTTIGGSLNVMSAGHFVFQLSYALMSPQLNLSMKGKLDSMNASLFNDYLVHAEPFKLTGGIVQGTEISVEAKDSMLHVLTLPLYDNLRVEFFQNYIVPASIASFFGNLLFIRGHNTIEKDHPPHTGELTTEMDRANSFWWSLWLPMRESIDQVLGIPDRVW